MGCRMPPTHVTKQHSSQLQALEALAGSWLSQARGQHYREQWSWPARDFPTSSKPSSTCRSNSSSSTSTAASHAHGLLVVQTACDTTSKHGSLLSQSGLSPACKSNLCSAAPAVQGIVLHCCYYCCCGPPGHGTVWATRLWPAVLPTLTSRVVSTGCSICSCLVQHAVCWVCTMLHH